MQGNQTPIKSMRDVLNSENNNTPNTGAFNAQVEELERINKNVENELRIEK
jgi:hypothetical protein